MWYSEYCCYLECWYDIKRYKRTLSWESEGIKLERRRIWIRIRDACHWNSFPCWVAHYCAWKKLPKKSWSSRHLVTLWAWRLRNIPKSWLWYGTSESRWKFWAKRIDSCSTIKGVMRFSGSCVCFICVSTSNEKGFASLRAILRTIELTVIYEYQSVRPRSLQL